TGTSACPPGRRNPAAASRCTVRRRRDRCPAPRRYRARGRLALQNSPTWYGPRSLPGDFVFEGQLTDRDADLIAVRQREIVWREDARAGHQKGAMRKVELLPQVINQLLERALDM